MKPQTLKRLAPLALILLGLAIAGAGLPRKLAANTIDPIATLIQHGSRIVLTGPIRCTQTEWVDMRVTITQRTTGAIAEGRARLIGTTLEQHWVVIAEVRGDAEFEIGAATATAVAVTTRNGLPTDAHQWLVNVEVKQPL